MSKVLIIGAGPAGISCAYELAKENISSLLIEKESFAGGICRTIDYQGFKFDIGGHRFFSRSKAINNLWHYVLGEEFLSRRRKSRIFFNDNFFTYPLKLPEAALKIGLPRSLFIFADYLKAQFSFPKNNDDNFQDWIIKRFGRRLFELFFKSYTEKVWGISCKEISSEWAEQRIEGMSLFSLLKKSLLGMKQRELKTLLDSFYYPKYGAGQMYERMLEIALQNGARVKYNCEPQKIEIEDNRVINVALKDKPGGVSKVDVDYLVSSMPLSEIFPLFAPQAPREVLSAAEKLRYRSLINVGLIIKADSFLTDQWIYINDYGFKAARMQIYKNWSPYMGTQDKNLINLGMEYFCLKGDELWNSDDNALINLAKNELKKIGLFKEFEFVAGFAARVPYAYPVYTGSYRQDLEILNNYIVKIANLETVGRCGRHRYNNMDDSMISGLSAAANIIARRARE